MDMQRHHDYLDRLEQIIARTRKTIERSRGAISQAEQAKVTSAVLIADGTSRDITLA
jgi:hypothetical protein